MRIGVFTDSYRPYTSGVVRSIDTFTGHLRTLGHDVFIFAPNYPRCEKEARVYRYPSVPSITHPEYVVPIPISPPGVRALIKRLDLDIIHVHSPFLLGRVGAKYAKRFNIPLVFTYHTLYDQYLHYLPVAQSLSRWIVHKICQEFCNRCDLVVTPTKVISGILKEYGVATEIKVIPTGIETEDFKKGDPGWLRQRHQLPADEAVLLHVGRLGEEKNIGFLLKAFRDILQNEPRTSLVLVGGGPQEDHLKKLAEELGISSRVVFTGTLSREDTVHAYAGADLFLIASQTETQGLVIGEAKASGLPVVGIRAFGVAEMVSDQVDGFLTGPTLEEFVPPVLRLLRDADLRAQMQAEALRGIVNMSARSSTLLLAEAYEDLARKKQQDRMNGIAI
ncbi:MAG: glycosyltransferase family 4 protein [Bacillota bacterium]